MPRSIKSSFDRVSSARVYPYSTFDSMANPRERDTVAALALRYMNQQDADLTVVCNGKEYNVRRSLITPQSKYFERACNGMAKEGIDSKIELHDDLPKSVDRMMYYFYNSDYYDCQIGDHKRPFRSNEAGLHIQMYCIADKYDVPALHRLALKNYKSVIAGPHVRWYKLERTTILFNKAQLPESDTTLRDLLVDAWLSSGCATDMATNSPEKFTKLMSETPWLSIAINLRTLSASKGTGYTEQAHSEEFETW